MLFSMTGHGAAKVRSDIVEALVEIRSVNNRFLKLTISGDLDATTQAKIESMIRDKVQRGALNVRVQLDFSITESHFQINTNQLESYQQQLQQAGKSVTLDSLLNLPGIVIESASEDRLSAAWPTIEQVATEALDQFISMRRQEGDAMLADLSANCDSLEQQINAIKEIAPSVVENYSVRLTDRINRLLKEHDVSVNPSELLKEVGVFAEKIDISEELVRLDSHIEQFRIIAQSEPSNGRKLDFLVQELLRETNTIGSKASSALIAGHVVEMKTIIERMREMIQNIE